GRRRAACWAATVFPAPLHRRGSPRGGRRSPSPHPAPANAAFAPRSWLTPAARAGGGVFQYQGHEHPALETHEIAGVADLHAVRVDGPRRRLHLDRLVRDDIAAADVHDCLVEE